MEELSAKRIAMYLGGAWVVGVILAFWLTTPPAPASSTDLDPLPWTLPEVPRTGSGMPLARSILDRQPWGVAMPAVTTDSPQDQDDPAQAEELRTIISRWRYLGSVDQAGDRSAVFLDEQGRAYAFRLGDRVAEKLQLSEIGREYAVFDGLDGQAPIRLELFRRTVLEFEDQVRSDTPEETAAGESE